MKNGEDKRRHLMMIQAVITRMASNLFYLRGWSITLVGAILVLLSQNDAIKAFPVIIVFFILLMLWVYDGYFLSLERRSRDLYNKVRRLPNDKIDFSMNLSEFDCCKKNTFIYCMFSKTIAPFYILSIAGTIYLVIDKLIP